MAYYDARRGGSSGRTRFKIDSEVSGPAAKRTYQTRHAGAGSVQPASGALDVATSYAGAGSAEGAIRSRASSTTATLTTSGTAISRTTSAISTAPIERGPTYQQLFTLYDKRDWASSVAEHAASEDDSEESSMVLLASGVSEADFIRFEEKIAESKAAGRGKVYMCLRNHNIFIYDLPLTRHEIPKVRFESRMDVYADAQEARAGRIHFIPEGSSFYGIVAGTRREPDASLSHPGRAFPNVVAEFGASETIMDLDLDAQEWLRTPCQAVFIARVYPRQKVPPGQVGLGAYAAFAALYIKGAAPIAGAPARTANHGALPNTAPVAAWSFGTAPLQAGAAAHAAALGANIVGIGFGAAAPLCNAAGIPAFRVTIPGAALYHGAPAGIVPPSGINDFHFDLFDFVKRLAEYPTF